MKNFGSGGAISFHIGPIFNGRQPLEGLKVGVPEPVLRQNQTFGPILWPLMKVISTEHDILDNFKSRGSTGFDFGANGNSEIQLHIATHPTRKNVLTKRSRMF